MASKQDRIKQRQDLPESHHPEIGKRRVDVALWDVGLVGVVVKSWQLDLMTLVLFSSLNDCMILSEYRGRHQPPANLPDARWKASAPGSSQAEVS